MKKIQIFIIPILCLVFGIIIGVILQLNLTISELDNKIPNNESISQPNTKKIAEIYTEGLKEGTQQGFQSAIKQIINHFKDKDELILTEILSDEQKNKNQSPEQITLIIKQEENK